MAGAPFLAHYAAGLNTSEAAAVAAGAASSSAAVAVPLYAFCGGCLLAITFYGGTFSVLPAYIADLWGQKHAGAIHGKALTAWSAASVTGPMGLAALRGHEERKAIHGLLQEADPAEFERAFGTSRLDSDAVSTLIDAKTVTIARLMELAPVGTQDPTPFLYDSTCMAAAGLLGMAAVSHAFLYPPNVAELLAKSDGPDQKLVK
uniref:Uncharacterized protein n=1 Tax=Octactis speculum TaxID=3111310 RepID=A0A7S2GCQ9_9STRA|mmetsp:Transcript_43290/g.59175  ORF Transcript_43290/g.59175 Transcript_43290/m.59175 type:complete len:204 (+) Transcript_43290:1-612(+)